jgi:hypothetical protein
MVSIRLQLKVDLFQRNNHQRQSELRRAPNLLGTGEGCPKTNATSRQIADAHGGNELFRLRTRGSVIRRVPKIGTIASSSDISLFRLLLGQGPWAPQSPAPARGGWRGWSRRRRRLLIGSIIVHVIAYLADINFAVCGILVGLPRLHIGIEVSLAGDDMGILPACQAGSGYWPGSAPD